MDIGYCKSSFYQIEFTNKIEILKEHYMEDFGVRNIDYLILEYLNNTMISEYGLNVKDNVKL